MYRLTTTAMRQIWTIILALAACGIARAQTMDSLFVQVPAAELPLLGRNPRLDMLDLYNYRMNAKGENIFGGTSVMLQKDSDFVEVQLTEVSRWQLMRLRDDSLSLYSCVHTLLEPVPASRLRFYRTDWTVDTTQVGALRLSLSDFLVPTDSLSPERREEVLRRLGSPRTAAAWTRTADGLPRLTFTVPVDGLGREDKSDAARCLRPVSFVWRTGRFEREP